MLITSAASATAQIIIGALGGIAGFVIASLILTFYAIVAGWMMAFCLASVADLIGLTDFSRWLMTFGVHGSETQSGTRRHVGAVVACFKPARGPRGTSAGTSSLPRRSRLRGAAVSAQWPRAAARLQRS